MNIYKILVYFLLLFYSVFLILLPISIAAINMNIPTEEIIKKEDCSSVESLVENSTEEVSLYSICYEAEPCSIAFIEEENNDEELTLYESLSEEEITLIELTVQHEAGSFSIEYKELIAGIILNRLNSPDFPDTITEILYAKNQFSNGNYYGVVIDEETSQAVKNVFSSEASPHEATYYYNPNLSASYAISWFEYSGDVEYLFSYSEEDWGIIYNTRFFK